MEFGIRNSELGMNPHPPTVELPAGGRKFEIRNPKSEIEPWRKK